MIDREFYKDSRPWRVNSGMIETEDGTPIAHMDRETGNGTSPTERDQNAHFIVEACNAYIFPEERAEITAELAKIGYALADIRETLNNYPADGPPHPYVGEKLAERDELLTRQAALDRKLTKLEDAEQAAEKAARQQEQAAGDRDRFELYIDLENAAMHESPCNQVIADMLLDLARRIRHSETGNSFRIKDYNGNTVGNADIIKTYK